MAELNFKRAEGFVGGGNATKFIDENFKVCPICHTHEPHWSACGELHGVGGASVFEKSFGYIKCDKCQAIYKHKMIDLLKFTDRNVLRTPFGKKIDVGSLDVNDIEFEIYNTGIDPTAAQYLGTKFTVRMMNADILRVQEGHTPNPSGQEAYAESKGSSMFSYIGDKVNGETVSDIAAKKEMIKNEEEMITEISILKNKNVDKVLSFGTIENEVAYTILNKFYLLLESAISHNFRNL